MTQVSMVICTHRRFDLLVGAVKSLVDQTASPESYEIIVVDNDREPNVCIQRTVEEVSRDNSIWYVHEERIGLSHARNAGGRFARASYIGYMDDDAKANPTYISTLLRLLKEHSPDICGGPYYPFYLDRKPEWFRATYGTGTKGEATRHLSNQEYLDGGNIIFRRLLLDELGWFDPQFGMSGKDMGFGEETAVQIKAWNVHPDLKVYYDPSLQIQHFVPAFKMSVSYHIQRSYEMGRAQAYFWIAEEEHCLARRRALLQLADAFLVLVRMAVGILTRDRREYPFWQNYVVEKIGRHFGTIGAKVRLSSDFLSDWIHNPMKSNRSTLTNIQ